MHKSTQHKEQVRNSHRGTISKLFGRRFWRWHSYSFSCTGKNDAKCQYSKSGSTFTSYTFSINCVFNKNSIPNEATGRTRLVATAQVDYYNNSNSKLFTNTISSTASDPLPTSRSCLEFVKSSIPSYSLAGATGYADGLIPPRSVSVRLNYTF